MSIGVAECPAIQQMRVVDLGAALRGEAPNRHGCSGQEPVVVNVRGKGAQEASGEDREDEEMNRR